VCVCVCVCACARARVCVCVAPYLRGWSKAWTVVELYAGFYVYITAWFVFDLTSPGSLESLKRVLDVNVVSFHHLRGMCVHVYLMCLY
jgi:hypothetical protein